MSGEQFLPSRDATGDALEKLAGSGQLSSSGEMTKMSAGSGEQFLPNGDERRVVFYPPWTPPGIKERVNETGRLEQQIVYSRLISPVQCSSRG